MPQRQRIDVGAAGDVLRASLPQRDDILGRFASAAGEKGSESYAPRCVVKLRVTMRQAYRGHVFDLCCFLAAMFVPCVAFIRPRAAGNSHGGRARADLSIDGQQSNDTTGRLATVNLALCGIAGQIAHDNTVHHDRFYDLEADFILANPPARPAAGGEHF